MSTSPLRILPSSSSGKVIAFYGYVIAIFGGLCAYLYTITPYTCSSGDRQGLQSKSMALAALQLCATTACAGATALLSRHDTRRYKVCLVVAVSALALLELIVIVGYGFAAGTACSA